MTKIKRGKKVERAVREKKMCRKGKSSDFRVNLFTWLLIGQTILLPTSARSNQLNNKYLLVSSDSHPKSLEFFIGCKFIGLATLFWMGTPSNVGQSYEEFSRIIYLSIMFR